ncbi:hypothetical protein J7426_14250 [Tropicibacter sp. R16_0]|uniref:hypothetical protein n=1 Tax=Tropicibacter sp. R16_0 TaxID=2821102 RepID=UPI001ADA156B|nr:hypothetical protein [Tropicibacter sp. R16_0]MBO9451431.1 hypothetical protein [Tropicibacter sp. R16_0]
MSKLDDNKATYQRQIDRIQGEIVEADGTGESERLAQLKEALGIEQRLLERLGE